MNDHNLKALYFCNKHPNLFAQAKCKSCKRGMCHTCAHHNENFCSDCLKQNKRFNSTIEDVQDLKAVLIFSVILTIFFTLLVLYKKSNAPDFVLTDNFLIILYLTFSTVNFYLILKNTDFVKSVSKIPFLGFKLAIILVLLIIVSGIPILYMLYKSIMVVRDAYLRHS